MTQDQRIRRRESVLKIIPGFSVWLTFLLFVVLSVVEPSLVVFLILVYDVYWLLKAVVVSVHLISGYKRLMRDQRVNWLGRLDRLRDVPRYLRELKEELESARTQGAATYKTVAEEYVRIDHLSKTGVTTKEWNNLLQVLVIPTSKEELAVLDESLAAVAQSTFPLKRMVFVLATEERFLDLACANAAALREKYAHLFREFVVTTHPANTPGEARVKGANVTYALRRVKELVDEWGVAYEDVVVSVFDADTQPSSEYFSCLAYQYLSSDKPTRTSYQPIPLYDNNIHDTSALMRVVAVGHSFWHMIESSRPERLCTFSSHSMSFRALVDVDFYPTNVVSDDSRIFYRCLLAYEGDYRVEPMFVTVSMDAIPHTSFLGTIKSQYKQMNRWAWGVENFPYVVARFPEHPGISLLQKFLVVWRLFEANYTWATAALVISFGGWLPSLLGGEEFQRNVLSQNFLSVAQTLTTAALVGLFVCVIISLLMSSSKSPARTKPWYITGLQWALIPVTTILFGCLPSIDAQTRLMLGQEVAFVITEKKRQPGNAGGARS